MTTKKTLKWRLGKLPTAEELSLLVSTKIITADEAHSVLFSLEDTEEPSSDSLKKEIQFLRSLVEHLANHSSIVDALRIVQVPYRGSTWYEPYQQWSVSSQSPLNTGAYTSGAVSVRNVENPIKGFASIKTF